MFETITRIYEMGEFQTHGRVDENPTPYPLRY